jgi:outer membrane protein assembly factor BamD
MSPLMSRRGILLFSCALAVLVPACEDQGNSIFRTNPVYFPTPEQNYAYALKELKASNWISAEQYFQHIKNAFAFSRWATLAELGIADTEMGREKWIEAIDDYKTFIHAHPSHERVQDGYAAFKIGEGYFKQIPSDWFIMPPSYEKDQGPVLDALRELGAFKDQYADSPYKDKAQTMVDECIRRLADHELYVANFYLKAGKPHAAIGRLEGVVAKYPGAKREPETLLLLGKVLLKLDKPKEARVAFVKLAADHPQDYRAEKARLYVEFIDKRWPNLVDAPDHGDPKKRQPKEGLLPPDSGEVLPGTQPGGTPTSPPGTIAPPQNNTPPPQQAQ